MPKIPVYLLEDGGNVPTGYFANGHVELEEFLALAKADGHESLEFEDAKHLYGAWVTDPDYPADAEGGSILETSDVPKEHFEPITIVRLV